MRVEIQPARVTAIGTHSDCWKGVVMTFEEIHNELFGQHNEIRDLLGRIRSSDAAEYVTHLTQLRDLLVIHNKREDELLGGILPNIDAWGEVRALHMNEDHQAEHRSILEYVSALAVTADAADIEKLIDQLLEHLEDEEKTYMNAKVLRDDIISIGHSGG